MVVLIKPKRKLGSALHGVVIGMSMDPFAKGGLDKAFGFAVGTRGVRTSEDVLEAELRTEAAKRMGDIAAAVVGHDALNGYVERGEKGPSGEQETGGSRL